MATRPHVEDFRQAFRSKVMRTGLELRLSQNMIANLCAISGNAWPDHGTALSMSMVADAALEKRGLIKWVPERQGLRRARAWELTEIGECVVEMLKIAGVFLESDEMIEKRIRG